MNYTPSPLPPHQLLKIEALALLAAACCAFQLGFPHHWLLFACTFLAPDLSLLLFLRGPGRLAVAVYNLAHSYALPALLGIAALYLRRPLWGELALVWIAHIGFDRALGYGLKYTGQFRYTHLQAAAIPPAPAKLD